MHHAARRSHAHQAPPAIFICFIWVAISKDKGENGFQEVHALASFPLHPPPPHEVGVPIPKDIQWADPDSGTHATTIAIAVVVATAQAHKLAEGIVVMPV